MGDVVGSPRLMLIPCLDCSWKTKRLPGGARKSALGSTVFFAVAFAIALAVPVLFGATLDRRAAAVAAIAASVATAIEALLGNGLDNLVLPAGTVAAIELAHAAAT